jgi:hypothetical protein
MSVESIPKTKVVTIAKYSSEIIKELMKCYGYAITRDFILIRTRLQLEVKIKLEVIEQIIGGKLDKCWEAYNTVLKWSRIRGDILTKNALLDFVGVICVEPYEKLK